MIWHQFLDYLAQDERAVIYCWSPYEQKFCVRLWDTYRGNAQGYRVLSEGLVDQLAFVKEHFALPCRGYSIKQVAPVFGFRWQAEDVGGGNCEAWYGQWLDEPDAALREKILDYNLDDVRAMEVIHHALEAECAA